FPASAASRRARCCRTFALPTVIRISGNLLERHRSEEPELEDTSVPLRQSVEDAPGPIVGIALRERWIVDESDRGVDVDRRDFDPERSAPVSGEHGPRRRDEVSAYLRFRCADPKGL